MGNEEKIRVEKTRTGLPALWECGGGCSNTGEATIIASKDGRPKKPVYIKRAGHLSNREHALVVLSVGDYIIETSHKKKNYLIYIYKILSFDGDYAVAELTHEFRKGEWNESPPAYLQPAITAAMEKSTCYHCREPHFILE